MHLEFREEMKIFRRLWSTDISERPSSEVLASLQWKIMSAKRDYEFVGTDWVRFFEQKESLLPFLLSRGCPSAASVRVGVVRGVGCHRPLRIRRRTDNAEAAASAVALIREAE